MTKEQAKQSIRAIIETAASLREDLIALELEAYDAYVAVEPYKSMEELKNWFYFLQERARKAKDSIDDLEDMAE